MQDENTAQRNKAPLRWFTLGVIVGAAILLGIVVIRGATGSATSSASAANAATIRAIVREEVSAALKDAGTPRNMDTSSGVAPAIAPVAQAKVDVSIGKNIIGDTSAPATVIEYSDFQCPFCGRFQRDVYPRIFNTYIKTGKVKFAYKHSAFLGTESTQAGIASECAADQGKFWDYHDKLFASQNGENQGAFATANLVKFAEEIKLDTATFEDCLTKSKTAERVQRDTAEGQNIGVRGTPYFLVNGKPLVGAQPFEAFQQAIDAALNGVK